MKLLMLIIVPVLFAAKFQFIIEREGDDRVFAAFSEVTVPDSSGKVLFQGHTDKFGRVAVKAPRGAYTARVVHGQTPYRAPLSVDSTSKLDTVFLHAAP